MNRPSSGLRLSPPRPVARARASLRGWYLTLPGLATAWLGFRAGGFFPGQVGLVAFGARARARRPHHARPAAVRGLESRARTGFRRARGLGGLDARLGALVGRAGARAGGVRSHTALRAGSRADRQCRGPCRRPVAMLLRWTAAAFGAIALAGLLTRLRAGHVSDLGRLPARAGLVPAHLLERDGHRLRARRAARGAPDARAGASRASCGCSPRRRCRRSASRST